MKIFSASGSKDDITDVPGLKVGHSTDFSGVTGCTAILCEQGSIAAVDVRGGAPATHEFGALASPSLVQRCHAILFTGGSAFGLEAASGVTRFLSENDIGFQTRVRPVPIVPAAAIFDLAIGSADCYPSVIQGYEAAQVATNDLVEQGCVGAGTGATIAKLAGTERCLKGGLGSSSLIGPEGVIVGCLAVTNAIGSIYEPLSGEVIAAPRGEAGRFLSIEESLALHTATVEASRQNTTLICVATNASLSHSQLQRLTIHAHDGLSRSIFPVHTAADGDIAFALSTEEKELEEKHLLTLAVMTTLVVERAIVKSVKQAKTIEEIPSAGDWLSTRT